MRVMNAIGHFKARWHGAPSGDADAVQFACFGWNFSSKA